MRTLLALALSLSTASSLFAASAAPLLTLRAAPVYEMNGRLSGLTLVVNARLPDGSPARTSQHDWTISGPWGTRRWRGPAPDGFVWMTGEREGYLPGEYVLSGTLDGQAVRQVLTVRPAPPTMPVPRTIPVMVTSDWRAPFCQGAFPCWRQPLPDGRGMPANNLLFSVDLSAAEQKNLMVAQLITQAGDQSLGLLIKRRGGHLDFMGLPDSFLNVRVALCASLYNVPDLYAPASAPQQALRAHKVCSQNFKHGYVARNGWVDVTVPYDVLRKW
ncbi:hypothetical protein [Deinococcus sp.]|uniref:hypothetical protein n=1 Tax=Deinococcus sp. TaxID=47478 RepID=UPI0025DC08C6|nr:hypothetical protein [Deinococcus sp.]